MPFGLDEKEWQLINETELLIKRKEIYAKVHKTLFSIESALQEPVAISLAWLPDGVLSKSGKISKGEYLDGLPYMVLDYPRFALDGERFICRSLFHWGIGFSFILHMRGTLAEKAFLRLRSHQFEYPPAVLFNSEWQTDVRNFASLEEFLRNSDMEDANDCLWFGSFLTLTQIQNLENFVTLRYMDWVNILK